MLLPSCQCAFRPPPFQDHSRNPSRVTMSTSQANRGRSTPSSGYARPASANSPRPTAQQQYLALRSSSVLDNAAPASLRNRSPPRSSSSQSNPPFIQAGRQSFGSIQQPPYSYSPAPAHRATLGQYHGSIPQNDSNAPLNVPGPLSASRDRNYQMNGNLQNVTANTAPPRQRQPPSANANVQQHLTADGRAYYMDTATGKGMWAPAPQSSRYSAPAPVPMPPHSQAQRSPRVANVPADAAEAHALLQPLLSAQDSSERIHHARALSVTIRDDSVARMSLCNSEALTTLLRMLQFEIPADEAFFLLMCLTHLLIEESAQICCVSIPFCIPMLIQRAVKWNQISDQHHPNMCFAALANLCLQDDGCATCARTGVFRCLTSAFSSSQDSSSLHYSMRLLASLLCHPACSLAIMKHDGLLSSFYKSALVDGALEDAEVAESAALVLRSVYETCR
jgi:hypothetical protein